MASPAQDSDRILTAARQTLAEELGVTTAELGARLWVLSGDGFEGRYPGTHGETLRAIPTAAATSACAYPATAVNAMPSSVTQRPATARH